MIILKPVKKEKSGAFRREWETFDKEIGINWKERESTIGAFVSNRLAGYATLKMAGGVGYVGHLIVAQDFRGKGVGEALMGEAERICRKAGCHKLTVKTTEKHRAAFGLYKKLGYKTEAKLRKDKFKLTWHLLCKELA